MVPLPVRVAGTEAEEAIAAPLVVVGVPAAVSVVRHARAGRGGHRRGRRRQPARRPTVGPHPRRRAAHGSRLARPGPGAFVLAPQTPDEVRAPSLLVVVRLGVAMGTCSVRCPSRHVSAARAEQRPPLREWAVPHPAVAAGVTGAAPRGRGVARSGAVCVISTCAVELSAESARVLRVPARSDPTRGRRPAVSGRLAPPLSHCSAPRARPHTPKDPRDRDRRARRRPHPVSRHRRAAACSRAGPSGSAPHAVPVAAADPCRRRRAPGRRSLLTPGS